MALCKWEETNSRGGGTRLTRNLVHPRYIRGEDRGVIPISIFRPSQSRSFVATSAMPLSDLELVSQAMAGSEAPNARGANGANSNPPNGAATAANEPAATEAAHPSAAGDTAAPADSVAGIDLASLSVEERRVLAPIIDALRASDDSLDVDDIMKQLDAAGNVADNIEDRLDSLLSHLGELEAQVTEGEGEKK